MTPEDHINLCHSWRRLFLNNDGSFNPDAAVVIRDIEAMCGWMRTDIPADNNGNVDPYRAVAALGKRAVFAKIKTRLFEDLQSKKRKVEKQ